MQELANGLEKLLTYDGPNFEETFSLVFSVEYEKFGEMKVVELKEGGSEIPVTKANRLGKCINK